MRTDIIHTSPSFIPARAGLRGFSQDYFTSLYSITLSSVNDKVYDVLDDTINNRLYVAGNFTSIGGNSRNYGLIM